MLDLGGGGGLPGWICCSSLLVTVKSIAWTSVNRDVLARGQQ